MSDTDKLSILVFLLCLGCSMFFSSSETAITSYGDRRARRAIEEGGSGGKVWKWWIERPVDVLTTILLGNNVVNTIMGATATALAIRHLEGTERLGATYRAVQQELLRQHVLTFYPPVRQREGEREWRRVTVRVKRPGHVARAAGGYVP